MILKHRLVLRFVTFRGKLGNGNPSNGKLGIAYCVSKMHVVVNCNVTVVSDNDLLLLTETTTAWLLPCACLFCRLLLPSVSVASYMTM